MKEWYRRKREAFEEMFLRGEPQLDSVETFYSPTNRYSLELIRYRRGHFQVHRNPISTTAEISTALQAA